MRVYHHTDHAAAILWEGFLDGRDAMGQHLTTQEFKGVFVADRPLDITEGADGDVVLILEIPEELFVEYEGVNERLVPDGQLRCYRESLIPAKLLNQYRKTLRGLVEDEEDQIPDDRFD